MKSSVSKRNSPYSNPLANIMKKIISIYILLFSTYLVLGQNYNYHNPNLDLKNGQKYFLFGDNVKFRKLPEKNSDVIDLLKIGTEIEIIEKSDNPINHNGLESFFYKVKHNRKFGYILGGLISLERVKSNKTDYFFTFKKDNNDYYLLIRYLDDNLKIVDLITELRTIEFTIDLYDNKGIEGIKNILYINYLAEACGVNGGGIFYFQLDNELKKVFEITQVVDGGVYWFNEELIFPTDENGVKNKIVYIKEYGEYLDEDTNWYETKKVSRELEWKKGEILPRIDRK